MATNITANTAPLVNATTAATVKKTTPTQIKKAEDSDAQQMIDFASTNIEAQKTTTAANEQSSAQKNSDSQMMAMMMSLMKGNPGADAAAQAAGQIGSAIANKGAQGGGEGEECKDGNCSAKNLTTPNTKLSPADIGSGYSGNSFEIASAVPQLQPGQALMQKPDTAVHRGDAEEPVEHNQQETLQTQIPIQEENFNV